MSKPYSMDLRERVVAAVQRDGLSRRQAAARFGVAESTAVHWLKRVETTGSVAPGQIGGHKPKTLVGEHREWLLARCREKDFTLRGLVAELGERRGLKVDYRSVWAFVHAEGLTHKKRRWSPKRGTAPTSRAGGRSGSPDRS
jgi:putative transposase